MTATQVCVDVDYQLAGKQQGYLRVPYSSNNAGWANLLIPITVVNNGAGPTVLAMGATTAMSTKGLLH